MSDLTRDSPERYSNSYPSSRRKPKTTTYHDGRSNEGEYVEDDYAATSPTTMYIPTGSTGNPYDNMRTVAAPNPRSNDVGPYSPEQQEQLSPYSFAPLNPYPRGGSHSLYALNSDTGNSSKLTAKDSYNKVKSATNQGNSYHGPISSTANTFNVLNVIYSGSLPSSSPNPTAAPFLPHASTNYVPQSDHPAPPMQPSLSDPSYDQRGGHRHSKDIENRHVYQAKHSYSYTQGQSSETILPHDKNAWSQTSKRDPREATSDRYKDSSSGPSPYQPQSEQYDPSGAKGFMPERQSSKGERGDNSQDSASRSRHRREREDRRQSETSGQDSEDEEGDEDVPKAYPIKPHRSRTGTLPPSTSSSWAGKEDDFTYGSPSNTRYNMTSSTDSVQTVRPDNHRSRHSSSSRDLASAQERDSPWASEPRLTHGSSSSSVHGSISSSPSSLPSTSSKASPRSTSLPTSSSLPSQPRQISGRPTNQDGQDTSPYSINYGSPSESRDHGRPTDFQSNRMYDPPPGTAPPPARGVSGPPRRDQGESWHRLPPPSAIQPQTSSRDPPRQESSINQSWVGPSNSTPYAYGTNASTGFGGDNRMEGRPIADPSSARVGPAPTGYQYPSQVGSGAWSGPYGTPSNSAPSGAMLSVPGGYSQSQASTSRPRYEHDLSQQFAQTSIINPPRGPLVPIPEAQHQSFANSMASFHDRESRASLSTLPDKYTSVGNPYLRPLRNKTEEGRRRKKAPDAENYISLYMASDIVDEDTTPLWTPCPKSRGATRQQHGIEVGDLGYMDESGEFTTIFNIFYSHEDNARRGAKPPPFNHYHPLPAERHEVVRKVDIQNNHFYLSENIERRSAQAPGQFRFSIKRKSGRSGAIIVLPHGGTTSTLRSRFFQYPQVKKYFQDNAASWYQHAHRSPDIPNLPNGSLIFVHGTHLARTWGIATFLSRKHDSGESQGISFVPGSSSNPYEYQWDWYTEKWKVKRGPSPEELASLQYGQRPPKNQCIGIIASSVFLDEKTWQTFFSVGRSPTSVTAASRVFNPFNRILSRVSSLSSIKVDRPPGRRYMESYLENQGGSRHAYDYDLFRIDV